MSTIYNMSITDEVKTHFNNILNQPQKINEVTIIKEVQRALTKQKAIVQVAYVSNHIIVLENMLNMLIDKKWHLSIEDKQYVLSALQYFTESNDVIPDDIPGVGLLDDCIVIDIVVEKIIDELKSYNEFSKAAKIYASDDEYYSVDQWIETKRKEMYSRLRHRRSRRLGGGRTRGTSFSIV